MPEEIGWEVLDLLGKGDLGAARKWLDWARDKVHMSAGDDPLAGQPFPHFWTTGQQGDESAIRAAALVLLPSKSLKPEHFAALIQARDHAADEAHRTELNLVLAYGYSAQEKWAQLLDVSQQLRKAAPDSFIAFNLATRAMAQLKKFDDWGKLLQIQIQKHPDDRQYVRSAAFLDLYRGEVVSARKRYKSLMDEGKATADDLNEYAWTALMLPGGVDQDALDAALRANDLTKNGSFAILHTLACLYSEAGKATQAREFLLKAMSVGKLEEPDSEVWFAYGKIAEQYGELSAAQKMFARMEKPTSIFPGASYDLAQQRIVALKNSSGVSKSGAD
ncbi:MAG TPA: hypothetical protein VJN64_04660 [Terriglobales bacterium]|nr:hypothetical protein [Terriglobales bacterium]